MLLRQKCTGRADRRLHLFFDRFVGISTSLCVFTPSDSSRNMALGGRSFVPLSTSCSNVWICGRDSHGCVVRIVVEFFVVFSCRRRCCCPSCNQKRALLLGMQLAEEVIAPVSHQQWVLTIPRRLRIFFRYDRHLPGKPCRPAYGTIRQSLRQACGALEGEPGYGGRSGRLLADGDLMGWHSHVPAILSEEFSRLRYKM